MAFLSSMIDAPLKFCTVTLMLSCTIYFGLFCIYRLWFHPLSNIPGPFLGKLTSLRSGFYAWKGDLHIDMLRCHEKYGNCVRYAPDRVLFNTNTGLKEIYSYSNNYRKSDLYSAMVHQAPNTLTLIDKKAHGRKRRVISQGFSEASMKIYEPAIKSHINTMCNQFAPGSEITGSEKCSTAFNMARWSNYLTFDIITDVIFGERYQLLEKNNYRHVIQDIEDSNVRTGVLLQAPELSVRRIDKRLFPESIKGRNNFIQFVGGLLKRRMSSKELKRKDVFSFLLQAKDPETQESLTTAEIAAESTTMVVAGSDTSSTAIASTLFYLTWNKNAYTRVAAEVRAAFPAGSEIALGPRLSSCKFLRACIDESLRMSPPASSSLWRRVVNDVKIDGISIPKGYDVGTCIYAIHHNAEYYPDSFCYRPERWLDGGDSIQGKSTGTSLAYSAFTPFSIGPRGCVGKTLAMTELMLVMATILSRFEFTAENAKVGGGLAGAKCGRHREGEYQLYDHVTAAKNGPMIRFTARG